MSGPVVGAGLPRPNAGFILSDWIQHRMKGFCEDRIRLHRDDRVGFPIRVRGAIPHPQDRRTARRSARFLVQILFSSKGPDWSPALAAPRWNTISSGHPTRSRWRSHGGGRGLLGREWADGQRLTGFPAVKVLLQGLEAGRGRGARIAPEHYLFGIARTRQGTGRTDVLHLM